MMRKLSWPSTLDSSISSPLARWYSLNEIPWDRLPNQETDTMLHRYFDESMGGRYSVYVGDSEQGKVHTLK